MRKIACCLVFILLSGSVLAQTHNQIEVEVGTMTATVIMPLNVTAPFSISLFELIQGQARTLTADNEWLFKIEGEPGRNVQINFLGPIALPEDPGDPVLSGAWYGPDNLPVPGNTGVYTIPDYPVDSFFDVYYKLDEIDASTATIGLKEYELGIEYCYEGL
jgi:hypothetical protein